MGVAYMNGVDYKSARDGVCKRPSQLNPELPRAHTLYGRALLGQRRPGGANRQFAARRWSSNPNDFDANLATGRHPTRATSGSTRR